MKKLLFILIILAVLIIGGISYATSRIHEDVTADDLSETVYATQETPSQGMEDTAIALFDPTNEDDQYTLVETFINFVIYDSIKENLNADYDPLGDCEEEACSTIVTSNIADIEYAYAHLNDDDQLILTVNADRGTYPSFETAVHLTFDIDLDIENTSIVLTLDKTHLADDEISESMLDRLIGYTDKEAIEDSVTTGTLDLDEKTYTYDFTE
ncbi:MAG: hypothetical protein ACOCSM_02395 [Bacillota bacterium]